MKSLLFPTLLFSILIGLIPLSVYADNQQGSMESVVIDGESYVKSYSLAKFLSGTENIDFPNKSGKIECAGFKIEYNLFSTYIKSGENIYNIYKPVLYQDGSFIFPVRYLVPVLNMLSSNNYYWDGKNLQESAPIWNVTGMSVSRKLNGLLVEIYMKEPLKYNVVENEGNWLVITISDANIDTMAFMLANTERIFNEIKVYQFENSGQISIRLKSGGFTVNTKLKDNPTRIQILIHAPGSPDTALVPESENTQETPSDAINIVVIDPGHGGDDNGAIGKSGLKEKDVVLKIANYLNSLLKDDSRFKPIMTRQDDVFVPLSDRTALANSVGADIFISIHANASRNKKAEGAMAFFLADAKNDEARAAATLENNSIKFENVENQKQYSTDLDFTLRDMVQTEFQRESADLSDIIQRKLTDITGINSRGVNQAGFFVLDRAYMTSVLVETAFISNAQDEKRLKDEKFLKQTARAIYESIIEFKGKYEKQ